MKRDEFEKREAAFARKEAELEDRARKGKELENAKEAAQKQKQVEVSKPKEATKVELKGPNFLDDYKIMSSAVLNKSNNWMGVVDAFYAKFPEYKDEFKKQVPESEHKQFCDKLLTKNLFWIKNDKEAVAAAALCYYFGTIEIRFQMCFKLKNSFLEIDFLNTNLYLINKDANQDEMREKGYIPLLKLVFEKHMNVAGVIQYACYAVAILAQNGI